MGRVKKNKEEKVILEEENTSIDNTINKENEISKKFTLNRDIILISILIIIFTLGMIVMWDKDAGPNYTLPLTLMGEAGLQELSYSEYQEKIDNKEHFVVIVERASCTYCKTYLPIAEEFAEENNLPMYYVDTDTFINEDWNTFEESNTYFKKVDGDWGTPTTLVLAGNEVVDYIEGATTKDNLIKLYDKYFNLDKE